MSEEILVNVSEQETRVALVENGMLQEIYIERHHARGIVGNIYQGKVVRILPGIQSAFVEIGLDRTAFLHQADLAVICEANTEKSHDLLTDELDENHHEDFQPDTNGESKNINIQDYLTEGQFIIVQVIKDPQGSKGARLSTSITVPARHLVYMPYSKHIGVSQKIKDESERERLKYLIESVVKQTFPDSVGGFIVRTVAESITEQDAIQDIQYLHKLWNRITQKIDEGVNGAKKVGLIHEDIPLLMRFMRDVVHDDIERIRIDNEHSYEKVKEFASDVMPEVSECIEAYQGSRQIFELYGIDEEINNALKRTASLKSGGYLVIDRTEAMTTIDVNTGGYVGRRNMEDTLFKTNLEAAQTIARQLRLRNLSGIIIVDFIDMKDEAHKQQVLQALSRELSRDRVKNNITEMSSLGLVEITRKRIRESLDETLSEICAVCHGKGMTKTAETICYEIVREIIRQVDSFNANQYLVIASQKVIDFFMDNDSQVLQNLQDKIGQPINLQVDNFYPVEMYDVILL